MSKVMESEKEPEVSILVPVYNVGRYLRQCLESIEAQTFKDWECVIVDDGATDDSGAICDEFARRDTRFKVLHVKNGGVAAARNLLVKEARGKFIAFCDPDDWVEPQFIEILHDMMVNEDADIAQVGFWKEFSDHTSPKSSFKEHTVLNREQAILELLKDRKIQSFLWNKMFRRELVSPIFPEGKLFEDVFVCGSWFGKSNRMVCDPRRLYHYRMRRGSIMHTHSAKYRLDYLNALNARGERILALQLPGFTKKDFDTFITKAFVKSAKVIARQEPDVDLRLDVLRQLSGKMKTMPLPGVKELGLKGWWRSRLLVSKPEFFCKLMRGVGKTDLHKRYRDHHVFD